MIDRISRHAAQNIWHSAIQHDASTGILLCSGDCIVDGLTMHANASLTQTIHTHQTEPSWKIGGMFHSKLPSVEKAQLWEEELIMLESTKRTTSFAHVYLDLHAAGLLKMAAYTIVNDAWLPRTLTMEQD